MKKWLDYDGKLMQILNTAADLMILNVLTVVFSIPVFTIGASVTAMHYTLYKIYRKEEETVFKDFLKAFRLNFAQSTILWLLFLLFAGVLAADYYLVTRVLNLTQMNVILVLLIFIGSILLLGALMWVFILQSRYENPVKNTIRNSFFAVFTQFPRTLGMFFLSCLPFFVLLLGGIGVPIVLGIGFSLAGFLQIKLYQSVFEKLEKTDEAKSKEEAEDVSCLDK